jgi:hypothetical protein
LQVDDAPRDEPEVATDIPAAISSSLEHAAKHVSFSASKSGKEHHEPKEEEPIKVVHILKPPNRPAPSPPVKMEALNDLKVQYVGQSSTGKWCSEDGSKSIDIVTISTTPAPAYAPKELSTISSPKRSLKSLEPLNDKSKGLQPIIKSAMELSPLPDLPSSRDKLSAEGLTIEADRASTSSSVKADDLNGGNEWRKMSPITPIVFSPQTPFTPSPLSPSRQSSPSTSLQMKALPETGIQLKTIELGSLAKLPDQKLKSLRDLRRDKKGDFASGSSLRESSQTMSISPGSRLFSSGKMFSSPPKNPTRQEVKDAKEQFKILSTRIQKAKAENVDNATIKADNEAYENLKQAIKCTTS